MIWSVLLILLGSPAFSLGATFDVDWVLGVSETLDVAVGDTIKFNWGQNISHNVDWTPELFPTSGTSSDFSHVETYVIPSLAAGNDYLAVCTIHPSMQVNVRVQSDQNSTSSPTPVPSESPSKSPTPKPTPFPTVMIITASTDSGGGMTTIVITGIIIASVAAIAAVGIAVWSYWRYQKNPGPRPVRIQAREF